MVDPHAELEQRDQEEAARLFPGARYRDVLGWLHEALAPRWYLEVGVAGGDSLACAGPETTCIAVDPEPAIRREVKARTFLIKGTSDGFFASGTAKDLMGDARLDLCFLDGLHTYDQTLKDFVNAVPLLAPGATVVFHDMLPLNDRVGSRERTSRFWTGDVWKIAPILQRFQPELDLVFVPTAPSGLMLVRGADAATLRLGEDFDKSVDWARDLVFDAGFSDAIWSLPRCENTRDAVLAAFPRPDRGEPA